MKHNPLIVALDVDNAAQARKLIAQLGDSVDFYKIGMELYAAEGIAFVREVVASGKQVFLDLKLYDISETVKRAVAVIAPTGVRFLTVHGINPVMRAAVEGRGAANLQLLAVTVLTSFDQQDVADLGCSMQLADLVALRARNAMTYGIDGIVCSALDTAAVRAIAGSHAILVNPGVRSKNAASGDQKRIATPAEAIAAGADYLVIGRQVTRSADPRAEVERILSELKQAWSFEYSLECPVPSEFAWRFWTDVTNWRLDADVESVELDGPFAAGSRGRTITRSAGSIEWRLAVVTPEAGAVVEFPLPGAIGQFHWKFENLDGHTRITQRVSILGEPASSLASGLAALEKGIPAGMQTLCDVMVKAASLTTAAR